MVGESRCVNGHTERVRLDFSGGDPGVDILETVLDNVIIAISSSSSSIIVRGV